MCDFSCSPLGRAPQRSATSLQLEISGPARAGSPHPKILRRPSAFFLTELAFSKEVALTTAGTGELTIGQTVAIFRQINKEQPRAHHDALEFPDGRIVLLTMLCDGQEAAILQLPAQPTTAAEEEAQKRVAYTG